MSENSLKTRAILAYAFIVFPVSFAGIPIYLFIPDYYHSVFNVSLISLSISLFLLRFFDALIDPLIGYLCDRLARYSIILLCIMAIFFITGFYILCVPLLSNKLSNLILGIFLTTISYSFFSIFINTKGALWRHNKLDKSKIISIRESIGISGVLLASILPFIFANYFSQSVSYRVYAFVFIGLFILGFCLFLIWFKNRALKKSLRQSNHHFKSYLSQMNKTGIFIYVTYFLSVTGSAIAGVMFVFFSKYVLLTENLTGLYLFLYFFGAILSMYFVKKMANIFNVLKLWMGSLFFAIINFSGTIFLSSNQSIVFSLISFFGGICFAFEIILPNLLLAQWIDTDNRKTLGNGYYALMSFMAKFSFALATIISLPWLDVSLTNMSTGNVLTIRLIYCLLPILFKILAIISLFIWQKHKVTQFDN